MRKEANGENPLCRRSFSDGGLENKKAAAEPALIH
jgi:hypothetical protein